MIFKWIEVPIAVKKDQSIPDAAGCNQGVDCFPNSYAMTSQDSEIPRSLNGNFLINHVHRLKGSEDSFGPVEISIVLKTLENFCQDQITDQ